MRKLIIKLYFGRIDVLGRSVDVSAITTFALLLPFAVLWVVMEPNIIIQACTLVVFAFSAFMHIKYFDLFPAKWDELNDRQRLYWGRYYDKFDFLKKPESLEEHWEEWHKLYKAFVESIK